VDIDVPPGLYGLQAVEVRLSRNNVAVVVSVRGPRQSPGGPYQLADALVVSSLLDRTLQVETEHIRF
jgi:hypothetical protein